jgi:hypothetical protein
MKRLSAQNPTGHVVAEFVHVPAADVRSAEDMTEAWKLMLARLVDYREQLVADRDAVRGANIGADAMLPVVHEAPSY